MPDEKEQVTRGEMLQALGFIEKRRVKKWEKGSLMDKSLRATRAIIEATGEAGK